MIQPIKRGDNPVAVLTNLKAHLAELKAKLDSAQSLQQQQSIAAQIMTDYLTINDDLAKIYKRRNDTVEGLKRQLRAVYDEAKSVVNERLAFVSLEEMAQAVVDVDLPQQLGDEDIVSASTDVSAISDLTPNPTPFAPMPSAEPQFPAVTNPAEDFLRTKFLELYNAKFTNDKASWFSGWFRQSNVNQNWTWQQILDHANGLNTTTSLCFFSANTGGRSADIIAQMKTMDFGAELAASPEALTLVEVEALLNPAAKAELSEQEIAVSSI